MTNPTHPELLALVAKLPSLETLDAVDDDLRSGTRPCPLHKLTINDVRLLHAFADQRVEEWRTGAPTGPWETEWFIAKTTYGDKVVLRGLPEEYTYDFTTADGTYYRRDVIACWMQFPDSAFNPPQAQAGAGDSVALIAAERQRHMAVEGWTPEHDDEHGDGALAVAAACYAAPVSSSSDDYSFTHPRDAILPLWPWAPGWWKPSPDNRIRELVKAGALIAAEIDRLQRAALEAKSCK